MKRLMILITLAALILGLFSIPGSNSSASAKSSRGAKIIDLLVQTTKEGGAVLSKIQKLGGEINYAYKNAPVIAATISTDQFKTIANLSNVVKLARDRIINLDYNDVQSSRSMAFWPDMSAVTLNSLDLAGIEIETRPEDYTSFLHSRANLIWQDTAYGKGSVVAVVDSGTVPNACLAHAVTGIPEYPQGYNATSDGIPATDPGNHWHGTHVGGAIASACQLLLPPNINDPLYQAISANMPLKSPFPFLDRLQGRKSTR